MSKILIIGAGNSGLTLAGLLVQKGYDPILVEQLGVPGGRARAGPRAGFKLDQGIHLVRDGKSGIICTTLSKLGIKLELVPLKPEAIYYAQGTGFREFGLSSIRELLAELELEMLWRLLQQLASHGFELIQASWRRPVQDLLQGTKDSAGFSRFLKLLCSMIVCPFLERASLGELLDALLGKLKRGMPRTSYPLGGFGIIPAKLVQHLESHGVKLMLKSRVKQILVDSGRAIGAKLEGAKLESDHIKADAVVCALPPQKLPQILPIQLDPSKIDHLAGLVPSCGIGLDYGLDSELIQHNSLMLIDSEPFLMGFCPSNLDPGLAPAGKQLVSFLGITSKHQLVGAELVRSSIKMESTIFKLFPELRSKIIFRRMIPFKIIDGVELNIWQSRPDRPHPGFLGIKGLFITGDYLCAPGAGGDLAFSSAQLCAEYLERALSEIP